MKKLSVCVNISSTCDSVIILMSIGKGFQVTLTKPKHVNICQDSTTSISTPFTYE